MDKHRDGDGDTGRDTVRDDLLVRGSLVPGDRTTRVVLSRLTLHTQLVAQFF
jgi:hypothetical protein